ncbi:MAG: hypothetical protein WBO46_17140 [Caldilineaceae bacterium]
MNSFAPVPTNLIDVTIPFSGYLDDGGNTLDVLQDVCGSASRAFPQALWIERSDWADKARENDKNKTWAANYVDRFTNQNPTHECTCHSLRTNAEAARNRQRGIIFADGPKKDFRYTESGQASVWLSPLSVYAEANPRQWGGANVRQVLEIACRRGMLPETKQPRAYEFKHAIHGTTGQGGMNQASGPWISVSSFPSGWEETAAKFKPLEVIFPESYEQAICLILHGYVVSVGRSGHAVPWDQLIFESGELKNVGYTDSYDVTRYDSARTARSAWSGSFTIATMTTPNSWDRPAE